MATQTNKTTNEAPSTTTTTTPAPNPNSIINEGEISSANINTKFWLVKIPRSIAEEWKSLENNDKVGDIKIVNSAEGPQIYMISKGEESKMNFSAPPALYVLTKEQGTTSNMTMDGYVEQTCNFMPRNFMSYGSYLKKRTVEANTKLRNTIKTDERGLRNRDLRPVNRPYNRPPEKKKVVDRAERMEKEQLVVLLSNLFQKQPHWGLKSLQDNTKQPLVYLKEVLAEICNYNKAGDNKNTYELKPEYSGGLSNADAKEAAPTPSTSNNMDEEWE